MQSFGVTAYSFSNSPNSGSGYEANYSPRLNFLEVGNNMNLSVGSHLGGGLSVSSQSGSSILLDVPLACELNIGHAANGNSSSNFGGFVGAGVGYNYMSYSDQLSSGTASTAGIYFDGGFKLMVREQSYGFRVSYLKAFSGSGSVLGMGIMYNIGDF